MSIVIQILQWFAGLLQFIFGIIVGSIIGGLFTAVIVVPRIMKNKKVEELLALLRALNELGEKIVKNQKNHE